MLELEEEKTSPTLIKVVGVGGGGMNAVDRMIDADLRGVEFFVVNTDEQVLKKSTAENQIQIGQKTTRGMGAGGDPDIGLRAAMEDKENIASALRGADMVFVTAGMGGGTGTGAAPIIAEVARELGALTVGVVTIPFEVEGRKRMELARQGVEALRDKVDTLITIKNEQLFKIIDRATSVNVAFRMVDDILHNAVKGISDLINTAGVVNVDFADVRAIMGETGDAIMGAGEGVGDNRAADAVGLAINNVLLEETGIEGATALLINVCGGEDMSITEWKEVSEIITEKADPRANIIIGLTVDQSLSERIRVTVIATGFRKKQAEAPQQRKEAAAGGQSIWRDYSVQETEPRAQAPSARRPVISLRQSEGAPPPAPEAGSFVQPAAPAAPHQAQARPAQPRPIQSRPAAPAREMPPMTQAAPVTDGHEVYDSVDFGEVVPDAGAYEQPAVPPQGAVRGTAAHRSQGRVGQNPAPGNGAGRGDIPAQGDFHGGGNRAGREKSPADAYPDKLDMDDLEIPAYLRRRGRS